MKTILITILSFTVVFSAFAAGGFSSLEEQMTGKEFSATGLEKLSKSELDALNAWIREHSLATLATTPTAAKTETVNTADNDSDKDQDKDKDKKKERTTITSKMIGKFTGWDGQTVFELENGQIWAQKGKKKFHSKEIENPVVIIEPGMFGAWNLQVEGLDSEEVRVVRIQ